MPGSDWRSRRRVHARHICAAWPGMLPHASSCDAYKKKKGIAMMPFLSLPAARSLTANRDSEPEVSTAPTEADALSSYFLLAGAFLAAGFLAAAFFAGAFFAGFLAAALANVLLLSMESRESAHARIVVQVSS
jgi:hypothetical protein